MNTRTDIRSQSIARRLILAVVLFSSLITLLVTGYQLYRDYNHDIFLIDSRLQQIQDVHLRNVADSLWVADSNEIQVIIEGIYQLPDMQYIEIRDASKVWAAVGQSSKENVIVRKYSLSHNHLGRELEIGVLTVVATLSGVYQRLVDRAVVILISNAIKTFLVAGFILLVFHFLVTRHLETIATFLRGQHGASISPTLRLIRQESEGTRSDELGMVVEEVNSLHGRLHDVLETLKTSEELFRSVAENAGDLIWVGSADWSKVIYVNPAYKKIWGRSQQSLIDNSMSWLEGLDPRDLPAVTEVIKTAAARHSDNDGIETTVVEFPEYRVIRPDGKKSWILAHAFPVRDDDGKILRMVGIGSDVSLIKQSELALKESEGRLGDIALNLPGVVYQFMIDAAGNPSFPYVSPKIKGIFGVEATEVTKDPGKWMELVYPDDRSNSNDAIQESFQELKSFNWEGRMISGSGETIWVRITSTPKKLDDGSVLWDGLLLDITERKALEDQLRQAQKMDAVGQLTGGIAHDFNNLLHVITGNLEMLDEDLRHDTGAQKMIAAAKGAAFRGGELTKQLLAFSREQSLTPEIINPNDLIIETTDILKRTISEDIMIRTALGDGLRRIGVDQGLLGNAILNLAINARDAMPKGGELLIETANVDLEQEPLGEEGGAVSGPHVAITVSDTGTGMDAETLEHVFEPFFTTKDVGKGSGMGLSMVYGFVTQSGGCVSIESEEGKGTAVRLYFPAADEIAADVKGTEVETKPVARGNETILIVDDDKEVRQITVAMLSRLGYEVLEAEDGPTALALLRDNGKDVDLVLSDVVMPSGMSGLELAYELRLHYQDIKVLMTSGYSEGSIGAEELGEIKATLLRKPFEFEELAAAVRDSFDQ